MVQAKFSLQELAALIAAKLQGDADYQITALATLEHAGPGELAFLANPRYQKFLNQSEAGAVILSPEMAEGYSGNALVTENPYLAYAHLSRHFEAKLTSYSTTSSTVSIDSSAVVDASVELSPGVVVGAGAVIAAGVKLGPNAVIGEGCQIGRDTVIEANVTLYHHVIIGERCLIHSGAVLGADGFGFANDKGRWVKIAQLGSVRLGNDVEVGAGTTIDRGALSDTTIANGVILDNQIQIAHNVEIGENSAIAGCTAVAGSTKIGKRCTIAGACGITGHLEIADDVHVTAMTLVSHSLKQKGVYSSGTGVQENGKWKKNVVRFRQLDELARRLNSVEKKINENKGS